MRLRRTVALLSCSAVVACSTDPSMQPGPTDVVTGVAPWHPAQQSGGHVPGSSDGTGMMFFAPGDFTFTGDLAPGSATFDAATVLDETSDPSIAGGGGTFDITVGGTAYASSAAQSLAMVISDGIDDYLLLGAIAIDTDPLTGLDHAKVVYVVVRADDFAPGASVALDGSERVALFAAGPADAPDPAVVGAAITGTVTFTSGSLTVGDTITATLTAEFGEIDWTSDPPPGGGAITAGDYTMTVDDASIGVYCDGAALAGHEADFAGITASDVGFASGTVTIATPTTDSITIDGASLAAGYGTTSLTLTQFPGDPDGIFAANVARTGTGPVATNLVEADLALDGATASPDLIRGWADVVYESADGSSLCAVGFNVLITSP